MTIRVMLVDDSAVVRGLIVRSLSSDPDIQIVASAVNGAMAIPVAKQHRPDIIVLDIEMPEMDGLTALPLLLEAAPGTRVIMASTLTLRNADISMRALGLGASDYVAKPSARDEKEQEAFFRELREKIHALAQSGVRKVPTSVTATLPVQTTKKPAITLAARSPITTSVKALAIACSTGGPQALLDLFTALKGHMNTVPIFITQHMPPTFTTILGQHLSKAGERLCREGVEGEQVKAGQAYIAPGNFHMVAERRDSSVVIRLNQEPAESFCRPAADPMLRSLSKIYGPELLVAVLTGMGSDGLEGAKIVVKAGGQVIAQDEATSIVWGMPGAVATNGLCRAVLPLAEIGHYLIRMVEHAA